MERRRFITRTVTGLFAFLPAARVLLRDTPAAIAAPTHAPGTVEMTVAVLGGTNKPKVPGVQIASLRKAFRGDVGSIHNPLTGEEHPLSLRSWAHLDPEQTRLHIKFTPKAGGSPLGVRPDLYCGACTVLAGTGCASGMCTGGKDCVFTQCTTYYTYYWYITDQCTGQCNTTVYYTPTCTGCCCA
jgi:hypothetical protein